MQPPWAWWRKRQRAAEVERRLQKQIADEEFQARANEAMNAGLDKIRETLLELRKRTGGWRTPIFETDPELTYTPDPSPETREYFHVEIPPERAR